MQIGEKHAHLTFLEDAGGGGAKNFYRRQGKFRCDCGTTVIKNISYVRNGQIQSCGCLVKANIRSVGKNNRLPKIGESTRNYLFQKYQKRAMERGLEWNITKDQFNRLTQENCFYCNDGPNTTTQIKGGYGSYTYNGIDRLDNDKGYVKSNVVTCCSVCNFLKGSFDIELFLSKIKQIYNHRIQNAN